MGMYVGGEIADLAAMARPSIGVVTAVQPVHLSRIGSIEAIEAAKGELLEALPAAGTAILNADDPIVRRMAARTAARSLTYGFADDADVAAEAVTSAGTAGMRFTLRRRRRAPTRHDALARPARRSTTRWPRRPSGSRPASPLDAIVEGLAAGWSAPHRMTLVRLADVTVIDDSYNASPGSVAAALEVLADLPGRPVAVLGEMLELGDAHEDGHRAVGDAAGRTRRRCWSSSARRSGRSPTARRGRGARTRPDLRRARREPARWRSSGRACATATSCWSRGRAASASTRLVDALRAERGPAR